MNENINVEFEAETERDLAQEKQKVLRERIANFLATYIFDDFDDSVSVSAAIVKSFIAYSIENKKNFRLIGGVGLHVDGDILTLTFTIDYGKLIHYTYSDMIQIPVDVEVCVTSPPQDEVLSMTVTYDKETISKSLYRSTLRSALSAAFVMQSLEEFAAKFQ